LIESSLLKSNALRDEVTEWRQKTKASKVEIGSMEDEIRALKFANFSATRRKVRRGKS
jgi:hypothetical protein